MDTLLNTCAHEQSSGAGLIFLNMLLTNLRVDTCGISPPSKWPADYGDVIDENDDESSKV